MPQTTGATFESVIILHVRPIQHVGSHGRSGASSGRIRMVVEVERWPKNGGSATPAVNEPLDERLAPFIIGLGSKKEEGDT